MTISKPDDTSSRPLKRFLVTATETLTFVAVIVATDAAAAEEQAWQAWDNNVETEVFRFKDFDLNGFYIEVDSP